MISRFLARWRKARTPTLTADEKVDENWAGLRATLEAGGVPEETARAAVRTAVKGRIGSWRLAAEEEKIVFTRVVGNVPLRLSRSAESLASAITIGQLANELEMITRSRDSCPGCGAQVEPQQTSGERAERVDSARCPICETPLTRRASERWQEAPGSTAEN